MIVVMHVHVCGYMITVQNCPGVSAISHSTPSTLLTVYDTTVTITCDVGYKVAGANYSDVTITCLDGGQWNAAFPVCEGNVMFNNAYRQN